jgi:adenylate cyclase
MADAEGRPVVLVVDDEPDIASTIADYLETALPWVRVRRAVSGAEALALLETVTPDLILSDYRMAGMDGLAFLAASVRRAPRATRVLMTAYPDTDLAVRAINEAGVRRFLIKPLDPTKVRALVEELLPEPLGIDPPRVPPPATPSPSDSKGMDRSRRRAETDDQASKRQAPTR